jgi:ADP-ribose pyrophosphatase
MVARWNLIDEREGTAGYIQVVVRRYALPDNTVGEWDIFGPDRSVAVLAITTAGEVVLARQYRPGPDAILDEMPGGAVNAGEEVADAAARELLEETGYAGTVHVVAQTWLAGAARTRRFVAVVREATQIAEPRNDPGEFCDVVRVPLAQFRAQLRAGQLTDVDLGYLALDHAGLLVQLPDT